MKVNNFNLQSEKIILRLIEDNKKNDLKINGAVLNV